MQLIHKKTHSKQTRPENMNPTLEVENKQNRPSSNKIGNFVAPSFWEALSHEVSEFHLENSEVHSMDVAKQLMSI